MYTEPLLRNQHQICNRLGASALSSSRHSIARTGTGYPHRLEAHLHLHSPAAGLRAGRVLRLRCSATADASRDSFMPFPTLYDFLEIPHHVGE